MSSGISSLSSSLNQANTALTSTFNRLATGKKQSSSADDAAAMAIATQLQGQLGASQQALQNINQGLSVTSTASDALNQVSGTLQRMRDLAVQASNATYSTSDRQALSAEFSQLSEGIDQSASQTQYNDQNLLDGSFSAEIQSGPNQGDTQTLALASISTASLGLGGLDLSSSENAAAAVSAIDSALASVASEQSSVGAAQATLTSTQATLTGTYSNLAASSSRTSDADLAAASANLSSEKVQQQAAISAISLYNANQASVLKLL